MRSAILTKCAILIKCSALPPENPIALPEDTIELNDIIRDNPVFVGQNDPPIDYNMYWAGITNSTVTIGQAGAPRGDAVHAESSTNPATFTLPRSNTDYLAYWADNTNPAAFMPQYNITGCPAYRRSNANNAESAAQTGCRTKNGMHTKYTRNGWPYKASISYYNRFPKYSTTGTRFAGQPAMRTENNGSMGAMDAAVRNKWPGTCSICKTAIYTTNELTENVWDADDAYLEKGSCPHCGYNTIHLGCALGSLCPISCSSCGREVCQRFDGLDELVKQFRNGVLTPTEMEMHPRAQAHLGALGDLETMQHSLIVLTLYSYSMTAGEIELLKMLVEDANDQYGVGARYPKIIYAIDGIQWIESVIRIRFIDELLNLLMDRRAFAAALPVLGTVITPRLIAKASEEQMIALIEFLAGYKGVHSTSRNALLMKITDTIEIVRFKQFKNDSIRELLMDIIESDSCAMIKYLVGRQRFGHQITEEEACALVEQCALRGTSEDECVPLLIYLANGYIKPNLLSAKNRITNIIEMFLQRNSNASSMRKYMEQLLDKCRRKQNQQQNSMRLMNTMARYDCNDRDFSLSEDLFLTIIKIPSCEDKCICSSAIQQKAGGTHIFRHMPLM